MSSLGISTGQFILDCNGERNHANPTCTLTPYSPPPATVDHYAFAPSWAYFLVFVIVVGIILALSILAYQKIQNPGVSRADRRLELRKAELVARARIAEAHDTCTTCGTIYAPKLEDLKT